MLPSGVSLSFSRAPTALVFFCDLQKTNIRKSLVDMETELKQPPPPSVLQGAASYANNGEHGQCL